MVADFHPEAQDELWKAIFNYEREVPGLGADLLTEVENAVEMLAAHPEAGQLVRFGRHEVHRWVFDRFPFVLFYVLQPAMKVLAVAHARRKPSYWLHGV